MNWQLIHTAVVRRMTELGLKRNADLAERMGRDTKTVTNLRNGEVSDDTLREASRALEWDDDALHRIGEGADPDSLPRRPWKPSVDQERRIQLLEAQVAQLGLKLGEIEDRMQGMVESVRQRPDGNSASSQSRV